MGTQSSVYSDHIFCNTINIVFFTSVNSDLIFSNGNGLECKSTLRDACGWSHQQQSIQVERGWCVRLSNFHWTGMLSLQPSATVPSCSSSTRKRSSISTNNACQKVTPWTVPSTTDTTAPFRPDTLSPWKTGRS